MSDLNNILLFNKMYDTTQASQQPDRTSAYNASAFSISARNRIDMANTKENILYTNFTEAPTTSEINKSIINMSQAKFVSYIDEDYDSSTLDKTAGNYWITLQTKRILFYTGQQFILYGGAAGSSNAQLDLTDWQ